jgi:ABC-type branched-subunit amino acid transport system substrate-binding protein
LFAVIAFSEASSELSGAQATGSILKIGFLLPPDEPQAQSLREGLLLAEEQANQASTSQVQVIIRGRVGQWGADAVEAARMATDEGADGLITPPDGSATHLVLQVSGRTAVPVVSLCADSSVSRTGVPWMVRVVPRTTEEATLLLSSLPSAVHGKTNQCVALVPEGRAGREIARDLRSAASARDCLLKQIIEINAALSDSNRIAGQVTRDQPAAVLLWLPPVSCGKLAKILRAAGYNGVLAGPGWLNSGEFIATAGDAIEGFLVSGILQNADTAARRRSFQAAYRQRWSYEPDWMAGMSYDAGMVLTQLLRQDVFKEHRLSPGFAWAGVTGDLRFDPEGNREVKLELLQGHSQGFRAFQKTF